MSVAESVTVSRLAGLQALRDRLASDLDGCGSARDSAALAQRLMDVLAQIESVEKAQPPQKGTPLDEFTRRRSERQASGASVPAKRRQRG